ncbi:hypothetical protein BDV19DRAFT_393980 [Aspergillus venezuelensis]
MASLETCPVEIIEHIISLLSLHDIYSFRLISRSLAARSPGPSLQSYLLRKHVDLTEKSLRYLVDLTSSPSKLGCRIEDLVLVGVVNDTKFPERKVMLCTKHGTVERAEAQRNLGILTSRQEEYDMMHASNVDIALLSQLFRNLMARGWRRGLRSLSLEVVVYRKDAQTRLHPADDAGDWTLIWKMTAESFHTTLTALSKSGIPLERLNIYSGQDRCSLACNELSCMNHELEALAISLGSLKQLAVSFSHQIIKEYEENIGQTGDSADEVEWDPDTHKPLGVQGRDSDDIQEKLYQRSAFSGLPSLIQRCGSLQSLELHYYQLVDLNNFGPNQHRQEFFTLHNESCRPIASVKAPGAPRPAY